MSQFVEYCILGITLGAVYASLGMALSLVYRGTSELNFAQGEMGTLVAFLSAFFLSLHFDIFYSILLSLLGGFALGILTYVGVLRPLRNRNELERIGIYIGLLLLFHGATGSLFGFDAMSYPSLVPEWFGEIIPHVAAHQLGLISFVIVEGLLLYFVLRRTTLGLKLRAVAFNREVAQLNAIDVEWYTAVTWGTAAVLGGLSAILVAPIVFLGQSMMIGILIYAFAGVLLGGISSVFGSAVGCLLVGLAEVLLGAYVVGNDLKLSSALLLIILVLAIKPTGLFGSTYRGRA